MENDELQEVDFSELKKDRSAHDNFGCFVIALVIGLVILGQLGYL